MFTNRLISNNALLAFTGLVLSMSSQAKAEGSFQFFGKGIDYWNEKNPKIQPSIQVIPSPGPQESPVGSAPSATGAFPWHQYLDPKNKEFFKEGDYTPPEPFMEIARNPSDSNLKLWFDYIAKKNELSDRLQLRMREYLSKNGATIPEDASERALERVSVASTPNPDTHRYRFRLYFDSHCPHCKRMFGTMADLQARGYYVEARQVDDGASDLRGLPIPVEKATPSEIQEKEIQSVPVLLVGDLKKQVVYRISGYQNTAQVLGAIPKEESHDER